MKNYFVIWSELGDPLDTFSFCCAASSPENAVSVCRLNRGQAITIHAVCQHSKKKW